MRAELYSGSPLITDVDICPPYIVGIDFYKGTDEHLNAYTPLPFFASFFLHFCLFLHEF